MTQKANFNEPVQTQKRIFPNPYHTVWLGNWIHSHFSISSFFTWLCFEMTRVSVCERAIQFQSKPTDSSRTSMQNLRDLINFLEASYKILIRLEPVCKIFSGLNKILRSSSQTYGPGNLLRTLGTLVLHTWSSTFWRYFLATPQPRHIDAKDVRRLCNWWRNSPQEEEQGSFCVLTCDYVFSISIFVLKIIRNRDVPKIKVQDSQISPAGDPS